MMNNPIVLTDPSGHFPILAAVVLIFVAIIASADTPVIAARSQVQAELSYYNECKAGVASVAQNSTSSANALVDMFATDLIPGDGPQERFEAILTGVDSGVGKYMDGDFTDSGFQSQFKDGGDQVGHFLQSAGLAYNSAGSVGDYVALSLVVGHEMQPDPQAEGIAENWGFFNQIGASALRPSTHGLFLDGTDGGYNVILNTFGDPTARDGNSIQDLRLSYQGWIFGKNMQMGYYRSRYESANWLQRHIAE